MPKMSAEKIRKRAVSGGSRPGIEFLISEKVANEVAARLRDYLEKHGFRPRNNNPPVRVKPSILHEGTWRVEFYNGLRLPSRMQGGESRNKRRDTFAREALESAFTANDLVKSWPLN